MHSQYKRYKGVKVAYRWYRSISRSKTNFATFASPPLAAEPLPPPHFAKKSSTFHNWSRMDSQSVLAKVYFSARKFAYVAHASLVECISCWRWWREGKVGGSIRNKVNSWKVILLLKFAVLWVKGSMHWSRLHLKHKENSSVWFYQK